MSSNVRCCIDKNILEEIAQENLRYLFIHSTNPHVHNVMEPLGYLNKIMDVGVEYDKEILTGKQ